MSGTIFCTVGMSPKVDFSPDPPDMNKEHTLTLAVGSQIENTVKPAQVFDPQTCQ